MKSLYKMNLLKKDTLKRKDEHEASKLVEEVLHNRLREHAWLVTRYLNTSMKQNRMSVKNTAEVVIRLAKYWLSTYKFKTIDFISRFGASSAATAAIASGFLANLIEAGFISGELSYLAVDPSKIARARKNCMKSARAEDKEKVWDNWNIIWWKKRSN